MRRSKAIPVTVAVICIIIGVVAVLIGAAIVGFDFTQLNAMTFDKKIYDIEEAFHSIDIRDLECEIRLVPSDDGKCRVICTESEKIINTVDVKNDTLTIIRTDTREWYERISIWWGTDMTLTVYLPESEYQSLYLKTVSGNIEVPDNFSFANAEVISTSGNIAFTAKTSSGLSVKSTSGELKIANVINGKVNIATTSGSITLSNSNGSDLTVRSTSGELNINTVIVTGHADLEAVSGNILLDNCDADSLRIKTVSGNVRGTLLLPKNFITDTTSGSIRVPTSDTSAGECRITTTSGNIHVTIA